MWSLCRPNRTSRTSGSSGTSLPAAFLALAGPLIAPVAFPTPAFSIDRLSVNGSTILSGGTTTSEALVRRYRACSVLFLAPSTRGGVDLLHFSCVLQKASLSGSYRAQFVRMRCRSCRKGGQHPQDYRVRRPIFRRLGVLQLHTTPATAGSQSQSNRGPRWRHLLFFKDGRDGGDIRCLHLLFGANPARCGRIPGTDRFGRQSAGSARFPTAISSRPRCMAMAGESEPTPEGMCGFPVPVGGLQQRASFSRSSSWVADDPSHILRQLQVHVVTAFDGVEAGFRLTISRTSWSRSRGEPEGAKVSTLTWTRPGTRTTNANQNPTRVSAFRAELALVALTQMARANQKAVHPINTPRKRTRDVPSPGADQSWPASCNPSRAAVAVSARSKTSRAAAFPRTSCVWETG